MEPLVDNGLGLDVFRVEVFALAILLGQVDGDGATLSQREVPIHKAGYGVVGIDLAGEG